MFLWPFLFVLTLAVIEGFRNWSHESLHQKLFSQNHIVNSVMTMVLLGLPVMTPFKTRHRLHMTHHRNLNQESDRERHAWHWAEGRKMGKLLLIRELVLSSVSLRFVQGALSARVKAEPVNRRQLAAGWTVVSRERHYFPSRMVPFLTRAPRWLRKMLDRYLATMVYFRLRRNL